MIVKTEKGEYVNMANAAMLRMTKQPARSAEYDCCYVLEACFPTQGGLLAVEMAWEDDEEIAGYMLEQTGDAWIRGDKCSDQVTGLQER